MDMIVWSGTLWFVVALGIVTAVLIVIDAVLLIRRRKIGRFGNLVTWIDAVLLLAGLPALTGFYIMTRLFTSIATTGIMELSHLFITAFFLVQMCGGLFCASFYAWAVLRLFYNRAAGKTTQRVAAPVQG